MVKKHKKRVLSFELGFQVLLRLTSMLQGRGGERREKFV